MADKLTMKQLKAELDELRAEVRGMAPLTDSPEPQAVSQEVLDKYESLKDSIDRLDTQIKKLGDTKSSNDKAMLELREAVQKDIESIRKGYAEMVDSYSVMSESVQTDYQDMEEKVDRFEKELAEARNIVTGLRDDGESAKMITAQDKKIAEMRTQMETVFSRMTRAESRADIAEENFQKLKTESRRERALIGVVAGLAAGFACVILALALAGMI